MAAAFWTTSRGGGSDLQGKWAKRSKIKGPDNPTSQLLPIMSIKGCSRDGEGRKGKGGGEGSRS